MNNNQKIALEMLEQIDRARSGTMNLEQLEENLWRLLDAAGRDFPVVVAGKVDEMVQDLRRLRSENRAFSKTAEIDEDRGSEMIFNEIIASLSRILG